MAVQFVSHIAEVKQATSAALNRAAEIIGGMMESNAKDLCPVKTGRLRGSITHEVEAGEQITVAVGTNVEYAPYVELGHNQEPGRYVPAIGKRLVRSWAPGHPFIRPAVENHVSDYREVVETECAGL